MEVMQNLFPDTREYIPFPTLFREVATLMLETARAGMLPLLIVFLLGHESAHIHHEAAPPMPPASHFELMQSVGPDVPFIPFDNSANEMIIRNANAQRQRAVWMSTMSWSSPVWVEEST
jgi:hypothetical protein